MTSATAPLSASAEDSGLFTEASALDIFAQSRVRNYITRVAAPNGANGANTTVADVKVEVCASAGADKAEGNDAVKGGAPFKATLILPVDVLEDNAVRRQEIRAVGFGVDERSARVACCMHAELCLDALGIPVFTSERRQRERAAKARKEGRCAPLLSEAAPKELSSLALPPPVRFVAAHTAEPAVNGSPHAEASRKRCHGVPTKALYGEVKLTSYQPNYQPYPERGRHRGLSRGARPRRRYEQHAVRYGPDVFFTQLSEEFCRLQHVMMQRAGVAEDDDDDSNNNNTEVEEAKANEKGEAGSPRRDLATPVSDLDRSIPDARDGEGEGEGDHDAASALAQDGWLRLPDDGTSSSSPCDVAVLTQNGRLRSFGYRHPVRMQGVSGGESVACVDESEGGVFDLVEGDGETWCWNPDEPGPWCLHDPNAAARLTEYFQRTRRAAFADCVTVLTSREPSSFLDKRRRRFDVKEVRWFTATVALPEIATAGDASATATAAAAAVPPAAPTLSPCTAMGKATTAQKAVDLCAMHAEALLGYVGIPIFQKNPLQQVRYYAAGLEWGRCLSPEPRELPASGQAAPAVPKPLKEWHLNTKRRYRSCPMNLSEKLLALNRVVLGHYRQHLLEVDFSDHFYDEVIGLAEPCVRQYMLSQSHPFEAAYFTFVYQANSQYRCSVYLPLPGRYGVRGGYAIAASPKRARQLAALCAVDVLCALDAVPESCLRHADWQAMLKLRKEKNLQLPDPRTAQPHMRSPPGYREVLNTGSRRLPSTRDVWRVMVLDADAFDVVPPLYSRSAPSLSRNSIDWHQTLLRLFHTCMRYLAGWAPEDSWNHVHHYCGAQHFHGQRRVAANNYWLQLPVDEAVYGPRVAVGRCVTRLGALRQLCIHSLRVLHALRATPWDALAPSDLFLTVYKGNGAEMSEQLAMWAHVKSQVLSSNAEAENNTSLGDAPGGSSSTVREAEVVSVTVTDPRDDGAPPLSTRDTLSPHPTMSYELATCTFL